MSEITRKKFEEKKTPYVRDYKGRKLTLEEEAKRIAEIRKEEQRIKRELLQTQLESAYKALTILGHIKNNLDSAGLKLFEVTDYVYLERDKSALIAIRREIEVRRTMITALHLRWNELARDLERELKGK